MKWMKFPNGAVWPVDESGHVAGVTMADENHEGDLENYLDSISEAVTGSVSDLTDFAYFARGGGYVEFAGTYENHTDEDDLEEIDVQSDEFAQLIQKQFGLSEVEARHAVDSIASEYDEECVIKVTGSNRELRSPAYPAPCDYVRVVVSGLEVAYWVADELGEDPTEVMGALIGALAGREH